jgi:protein-tyrosine phosphatase
MDQVQILPHLFLGAVPRTAEDIDSLLRESGITAVLNLQTDDDMRSVNVDWKPLEEHYGKRKIVLRRCPVRDFDPVDLREKLPQCVRALEELLAEGYTVYLHCTAASGRSPTVAIAYLHWRLGWDLDQAVSYVKGLRDCVPNVDAIRLAKWSPGHREAADTPGPKQGTP